MPPKCKAQSSPKDTKLVKHENQVKNDDSLASNKGNRKQNCSGKIISNNGDKKSVCSNEKVENLSPEHLEEIHIQFKLNQLLQKN